MSNGLLKSINTKDRLYKKLIRTDIEDPQYVTLKNEFTNFKNTLRRSINEAKRLYYMRTFALYKNDVKQTLSVIKDTLQRKLHSSPSSKFILNNNTITDLDELPLSLINISLIFGDHYLIKFSQYTSAWIIYLNSISPLLFFPLIL